MRKKQARASFHQYAIPKQVRGCRMRASLLCRVKAMTTTTATAAARMTNGRAADGWVRKRLLAPPFGPFERLLVRP